MAEQTAPAKLLYDVDDVIQLIGIGRSKLYTYILSGELPSVKLGRRRKISAQALQKFVQQLEESSNLGSQW